MSDERKQVEPMFHVEPKHIKDCLSIDFSSGTKNVSISAFGNTPDEVKEMFDHAIKKWKEMKL